MLVQPGQLVDRRGVPIYPGDLLKSLHFTDTRRRKHWLYHVVISNQDTLEMVPTCHLELSFAKSGGRAWLSEDLAAAAEVIDGHGPGKYEDWTDRKRRHTP